MKHHLLKRYLLRGLQLSEFTPAHLASPLVVNGLRLFTLGLVLSFLAHFLLWSDNIRSWATLWLSPPQLVTTVAVVYPFLLAVIAGIFAAFRPCQERISQRIVLVITIFLLGRYWLWRTTTVVWQGDTLSVALSLLVYGIELVITAFTLLRLTLHFRADFASADRHQHSPLHAAVLQGQYHPSVDILIPTYNESVEILKRTVVGCQHLQYERKTIYLLDDGQRAAVQALAVELGCCYLSRHDRQGAKAGNLNYALAQTQGDLIVVFDADFVPTHNFLTRTVGYFQNPDIGLLQTRQGTYNHEAVARNLGLENWFPNEYEIFSAYYQVVRDGIQSMICYGSSFVVRRTCLEAVGGFTTFSLSEDYHTALLIAAQGYRQVFVDEVLSAGLMADFMSDRIAQKLRWARGTLQSLFVPANPLTLAGFSPLQRLAHLEGIVQWLMPVARLLFVALACLLPLSGAVIFDGTAEGFLRHVLPYALVTGLTFSWLHQGSRSLLFTEVYSLSECLPVAVEALQTLVRPFTRGFNVTPKGQCARRRQWNWRLLLPVLALFAWLGNVALGNALALGPNPQQWTLVGLVGLAGSSYGLLVTALAALSCVDQPLVQPWPTLGLRRYVQLRNAHQGCVGETVALSEGGATVQLAAGYRQRLALWPIGTALNLTLPDAHLTLQAQVQQVRVTGQQVTVELVFEPLSLAQYRQLVGLLFCQPGRWLKLHSPPEPVVLLGLLGALAWPRMLRRASRPSPALRVSQG